MEPSPTVQRTRLASIRLMLREKAIPLDVPGHTLRRALLRHFPKILTLGATLLSLLAVVPTAPSNAQEQGKGGLSKVKTVWVILMENHNWTGNNTGAKSGAPDIKGNPLAPYINGTLLQTSAHAEQYFNPPQNHPSQPNYLWLEAGTNFGVLSDTQPGQPQLSTGQHLVKLLENAGISWRAYAEPDFGSPVFDGCPLDFTFLDVEHLPFVYFNDVNDGLNPRSSECIAHVRPYYQLATDLANRTSAQYNFIVPNVCHDGHEHVSPCDANEPADNTLRSDTWLKQNVPLILESDEYKKGGALFIIWDEAEDSGIFRDGPIGMFLLSPFAKGGGKQAYSNSVHYDHSSTLKTLQEIFNVNPLLGAAAYSNTYDLSDLFKENCRGDDCRE
jgi:phospholipase C